MTLIFQLTEHRHFVFEMVGRFCVVLILMIKMSVSRSYIWISDTNSLFCSLINGIVFSYAPGTGLLIRPTKKELYSALKSWAKY